MREHTRMIEHVCANCECRTAQQGWDALRELDALLAENDSLREALVKIKRVVEDYPARPTYACLTATEIAANALKPTGLSVSGRGAA